MERELTVYMDLNRVPTLVGRLWVRTKGQTEASGFAYDPKWIRNPNGFQLGPNLPKTAGHFTSKEGLFNEFRDPAPDRWGQKVMRHYERQRAKVAGTTARTLRGVDFLAGVDDPTRLGALRFKEAGGEEFITVGLNPVPPMIELNKLLSAADRVEKGKERRGDLDVLLAPAGSLGGARPKATVLDKNGRLCMAKFPWDQDEWPVILWETSLLKMAKAAAIEVSPFRLETVGKKRVLLSERFDRQEASLRIPYVSVCTMIDAKDHETRSYMEIVDVLRQSGADPARDIAQLWRRMVFNVLVSNTDDHVRNHGFLWAGRGWRLSPAFDMNPRPTHRHPRIHQMALNEMETSGSLEVLLETSAYFGLGKKEAEKVAGEVAAVVSQWRIFAAGAGLTKAQCEYMETAFEHEDLEQGAKLHSGKIAVAISVKKAVKKTASKKSPAKASPRKVAKAKRAAK